MRSRDDLFNFSDRSGDYARRAYIIKELANSKNRRHRLYAAERLWIPLGDVNIDETRQALEADADDEVRTVALKQARRKKR